MLTDSFPESMPQLYDSLYPSPRLYGKTSEEIYELITNSFVTGLYRFLISFVHSGTSQSINVSLILYSLYCPRLVANAQAKSCESKYKLRSLSEFIPSFCNWNTSFSTST